jgi:hypothetical protein
VYRRSNGAARRRWQRRLLCEVKSLAYDCTTCVGKLYMLEGDCVDMESCIAFFQRLAPEVRAIHTYSGACLDTCYRRRGDTWQVIPPPEPEEARRG